MNTPEARQTYAASVARVEQMQQAATYGYTFRMETTIRYVRTDFSFVTFLYNLTCVNFSDV